MRPLDDVKRDAILRKQYKDVHKKVVEEKKRIKDEAMEEKKKEEEESKKTAEDAKKKADDIKNKANKADDDLVVNPYEEELKDGGGNGPNNKVHPEDSIGKKTTPTPATTTGKKNPQD